MWSDNLNTGIGVLLGVYIAGDSGRLVHHLCTSFSRTTRQLTFQQLPQSRHNVCQLSLARLALAIFSHPHVCPNSGRFYWDRYHLWNLSTGDRTIQRRCFVSSSRFTSYSPYVYIFPTDVLFSDLTVLLSRPEDGDNAMRSRRSQRRLQPRTEIKSRWKYKFPYESVLPILCTYRFERMANRVSEISIRHWSFVR